ncbi:FecR domain-containing protein [Herbaspirillum sp. WKF16]|uniref:FecR domain-containing protein n=1 Tax=Herbaspirillum sp. WKF16 TaxID=3028312 RepID=UPI0023A98603|nr:FecR domain-containing protein [Herbaspirillum sp. WKF16]WDZ97240.1 FecR domain-containing protein [Herbaspirillum sp. WKF16]
MTVASEPVLPDAILEQAADWFALLISGEANPADHARWRAWLQASPLHRQAWSYVEAVSQRMVAPVQGTADPRLAADNIQAANERIRRRRRSLSALLVLMGAGTAGWLAWRHTPLADAALAWTADYHTGVGEIREVALPDGTHVWLNTASAFNRDYRADLRRLDLLKGEILIATAHDAARPFVVDTPAGRLRALGTRFTLRQESDAVLLAVYQGSVEIRTAASDAVSVIGAGQQARFRPEGIEPVSRVDEARQAWSRGSLVAADVPLGELVAELRRYTMQHIGLDADVAARRVFGTFPLNDIDKSLELVAHAAHLRIRRPLPWWATLTAANGSQAQP